MKKNLFKWLPLLLMTLIFNAFFTACDSKPEAPENEVLHKDHGDPFRAELMVFEGHFHDAKGTPLEQRHAFHQNPVYDSNVKYIKNAFRFVFESTPKGWKLTDDSDKKLVVRSKGEGEAIPAYGLWIRYYDAKGKDITAEFIENRQDQIHQHFFIPRSVKPTFDGQAEAGDNASDAMFFYKYCDSTPWDKNTKNEGAKYTGDENPIGMKGWFVFHKARKEFDLSIELLHASTSKYDKSGKASPFHKPRPAQRQRDHWDLIISLPVVVYATLDEYIDVDSEEFNDPDGYNGAIENLSDSDRKLLRSVSKAFGITEEQALRDLFTIFEEGGDHESGARWM